MYLKDVVITLLLWLLAGPWKPPQIDNPDYQGEWVHPTIDNPEYEPDDALYKYDDFGVIGFDLWQVKSGTIFDNVLITDDEEYATQFGKETFEVTRDTEKAMKEKVWESNGLRPFFSFPLLMSTRFNYPNTIY